MVTNASKSLFRTTPSQTANQFDNHGNADKKHSELDDNRSKNGGALAGRRTENCLSRSIPPPSQNLQRQPLTLPLGHALRHFLCRSIRIYRSNILRCNMLISQLKKNIVCSGEDGHRRGHHRASSGVQGLGEGMNEPENEHTRWRFFYPFWRTYLDSRGYVIWKKMNAYSYWS